MNKLMWIAACILTASAASSATISLPIDPFGGTNGDVKNGLVRGTSAAGYSPLRWSYNDPAFAKPFDPAGDNRWGTDGYVMFANKGYALEPISAGQTVTALAANDTRIPTFVGAITYASAGTVQMPSGALYDDRLNPGATSVSDATDAGAQKLNAAAMTQTIGSYIYGNALTITITADTHFIMGVQMDFLAGTKYNANTGERAILTDGVSSATSLGYGPAAANKISDGQPDMVFFDVNAQAGDTLTLKIGNNTAIDTYYHGITFDVIP